MDGHRKRSIIKDVGDIPLVLAFYFETVEETKMNKSCCKLAYCIDSIRNRAVLPTSRVACVVMAALFALQAQAVDWSNTSGGNYTNEANWTGSIVPGPSDTANFANNTIFTIDWTCGWTNQSATFNGTANNSLNIGASSWFLTDSLVIGQNAGTRTTNTHSSGLIVVTNASGTGTLNIGPSGEGYFLLNGGTVTVDRIYVTNVVASSGSGIGFLDTQRGALNIRNGGIIILATNDVAGDKALGPGRRLASAGYCEWNLTGGTTLVYHVAAGTTFEVGNGSTKIGVINVMGSGTVLSNTGYLSQKGGTTSAFLNVRSGGRVEVGHTLYWGGTSNRVLVADPGSVIRVYNGVNDDCPYNDASYGLVVSNGGSFIGSGLIELGRGGVQSHMLITGSGSVCSNLNTVDNAFRIGYQGYSGSGRGFVDIRQGGVLSCLGTIVIAGGASTWTGQYVSPTGTLTVAGANSAVYAKRDSAANFVVGDYGDGTLVVSNGAKVASAHSSAMGYRQYNFTTTVGGAADKRTNDVFNPGRGTALVTGPDSMWTNRYYMYIGHQGYSNTLTIADGGLVQNGQYVLIGNQAVNIVTVTNRNPAYQYYTNKWLNVSRANRVTVDNGTFSNADYMILGNAGGENTLVITNGGKAYNSYAIMGNQSTVGTNMINNGSETTFVYYASSNSAIVTGPGSLWNSTSYVLVGVTGSYNSVAISNSAAMRVGGDLILGADPASSVGNLVSVFGGALYVTNDSTRLDVRSGQLTVGPGGQVAAYSLAVTNGSTLKFVLSATALPAVTVSGACTVDASSKLVVDMTGYRGALGARIPLMTSGSMPALFANANISVVGGAGRITQNNNSVFLALPVGTIVAIH